MKNILILTTALLLMPGITMAEDSPNYCLDPEVNAEWAKMLSETPKDNLVVGLFALRIGLCELVKRKVIDRDRAIDVFEKARASAVDERKADELRRKQKEGSST
jgi:ABC-type polar amino acid transport system ATPase subunit